MTKKQLILFIFESIIYIGILYLLFMFIIPTNLNIDKINAITIVIGCMAISVFSDTIFNSYIESILDSTLEKINSGASEKEINIMSKIVTFIISIDLAIVFQMVILWVVLIYFFNDKFLYFFNCSVLVFISLLILNIFIKCILKIMIKDSLYKEKLYVKLNAKMNNFINKIDFFQKEISCLDNDLDIEKINDLEKEINDLKKDFDKFSKGYTNFMKVFNNPVDKK